MKSLQQENNEGNCFYCFHKPDLVFEKNRFSAELKAKMMRHMPVTCISEAVLTGTGIDNYDECELFPR
jgi:hypothetical protein